MQTTRTETERHQRKHADMIKSDPKTLRLILEKQKSSQDRKSGYFPRSYTLLLRGTASTLKTMSKFGLL